MATGVFYTTSTGNSDEISERIAEILACEVFNISECGIDKINEFDKVIIGGSTWGDGDLNDDLEDVWAEFTELDFSSKTVALFGLGDQEGYPDTFVNALGTVYEQVLLKGATVIGSTSTDDYEYDESKAVVDGSFVGLVIDEDNQDDLTQQRIESWLDSIKGEIL
jgi:flavodoxin I